MDVYEVRRMQLERLVERFGGRPELAQALNLASVSRLSQVLSATKQYRISDKLATDWAYKLGLDPNYFDGGASATGTSIDVDLLEGVMRAVNASLVEHQMVLPPAALARLVSLVYVEAARTNGVLDVARVRDYVDLIKRSGSDDSVAGKTGGPL